MKNFFTQISNIWKHEELRQKLGITLGLILVYRIGSFIVIPGVNSDVLAEQLAASGSGGLGDLLSLFTGGAFTRASIFALGIMPYISASIIVQLLGIAVPAVQKMQAEGESGRKKINQYTRFFNHCNHVGSSSRLSGNFGCRRAGCCCESNNILVV
jgi:preprotein translocase subunit SecY